MLAADGTVGSDLRRSRLAAGLSIDEISAMTKIRNGIIEAIESNDFSLCGGATYARGHLRQIGKAVGLDPDDLVSRVNWSELDG